MKLIFAANPNTQPASKGNSIKKVHLAKHPHSEILLNSGGGGWKEDNKTLCTENESSGLWEHNYLIYSYTNNKLILTSLTHGMEICLRFCYKTC